MEVLRIALAQINSTVGDLAGNRTKIIELIRQAQEIKADIVTFPELALTGYPPEDLLLKKHFINDNLEELKTIISETKNITAIVGFADKDKKDNVYNAAAIINDCKLKHIYHKIELPNYGVFDEKRYFQPGNNILVFTLGRLTFGINICEDIWKEKGIAKLQSDRGARLIVNISASPYYAGKQKDREKMLSKRAKETKAYICYNNLVGGQDELVFDGASLIIDPRGKVLAIGKQFEEDMLVFDLPLEKLTMSRIKSKYIKRLSMTKNIEKPDLPKRKVDKLDKISEIYNALVLATRDYVKKNEFEKVVIGLSGGIDSSLTAVIACDAIGRENVVGVTMPSRYSSEETFSDVKILAKNLDIRLITVPIEGLFKVYLAVLENSFFGQKRDVTEENLQARIRGNILMAFSNKFNWLVLTTGNKSEISVGYCTLYGDTAGGFSVIKDVPKTIVYKLARFVNKKKNKPLIPESVILRTPSAELKENQTDQDTLPAYPILDAILKKYVEEDKGFDEITSYKKFNPDVVKDVIHKVDRNEYKRRQSPLGIKITPKAFGKDRRLPVTNKYRQI